MTSSVTLFYFSLVLCFASFIGNVNAQDCSKGSPATGRPSSPQMSDSVTIATLGGYWLFDGNNDPSTSKWQDSIRAWRHTQSLASMMAQIYSMHMVDVFVVSSVESCAMLSALLGNSSAVAQKGLAAYMIAGTDRVATSSQNVGLLSGIDLNPVTRITDTITYPIANTKCLPKVGGSTSIDLSRLAISKVKIGSRPPVIVIGIQLNAGTDNTACAQREAQCQLLGKYIKTTYEPMIAKRDISGVIVAGTFNEYSSVYPDAGGHVGSPCMDALRAQTDLYEVEAMLPQSQRFTVGFDSSSKDEKMMVDHILVSPQLVAFVNSVEIHRITDDWCSDRHSLILHLNYSSTSGSALNPDCTSMTQGLVMSFATMFESMREWMVLPALTEVIGQKDASTFSVVCKVRSTGSSTVVIVTSSANPSQGQLASFAQAALSRSAATFRDQLKLTSVTVVYPGSSPATYDNQPAPDTGNSDTVKWVLVAIIAFFGLLMIVMCGVLLTVCKNRQQTNNDRQGLLDKDREMTSIEAPVVSPAEPEKPKEPESSTNKDRGGIDPMLVTSPAPLVVEVTARSRAATPANEVNVQTILVIGRNGEGQLGFGEEVTIDEPAELDGLPFPIHDTQCVVAGSRTSFIITKSCVYVAGDNSSGQLGFPVCQKITLFRPLDLFLKDQVLEIAAGEQHTLILSSSGVYSMGQGEEGQLGHGDWNDSDIPRRISSFAESASVAMVRAGTHHSIVVYRGSMFTFGWGQYGQLMNGTTDDICVPTVVPHFQDETIVDVACGVYHNLVQTKRGVFSCGGGEYGQLGRGAVEWETTPSLIRAFSGKKVYHISCWFHSLVACNDGVYSFGEGAGGKLGHGNTSDLATPAPILALRGHTIGKVIAAAEHSFAISSDDKVFAWGKNSHGQLGLDELKDYLEPARCTKIGNVLDVACGASHTMVVL
eukprot:PhF_6_TR43129/c0_g1_i1/m.65975